MVRWSLRFRLIPWHSSLVFMMSSLLFYVWFVNVSWLVFFFAVYVHLELIFEALWTSIILAAYHRVCVRFRVTCSKTLSDHYRRDHYRLEAFRCGTCATQTLPFTPASCFCFLVSLQTSCKIFISFHHFLNNFPFFFYTNRCPVTVCVPPLPSLLHLHYDHSYFLVLISSILSSRCLFIFSICSFCCPKGSFSAIISIPLCSSLFHNYFMKHWNTSQ